MRPLLWDTCTAIWIYEKAQLFQAALEAMSAAHRDGRLRNEPSLM